MNIGNEIEGRNNLFSDKTLGTEFWKVAREAEGRRIWDQIEENLVPLDPSASLFVPGAKEHYMKNSYELNLNFMESSSVDGNNIRTCLKRKSNSEEIVLERPAKKVTFKTPEINELDSSTGGSYIEWMRLESDEESVNYEIASLFSDDESIIWMGDSLGIMKSPPMPTLQALPRPPVKLNVLGNLDLNVSKGTTRLPHYDVSIGGIMCDTIVDSSAGAIYLDTRVAKELLRRREITTKRIEDINVRLADGQIEKVGWIGPVRINFDNYEMDLEAYLIDLPDIDLVLGLPWLVSRRAVIDYDDVTYSLLDNIGKVVTLRTSNEWRNQSFELNFLNSKPPVPNCKTFLNPLHRLAYKTAPQCFREIVGLPKFKNFEHDIDTGSAAAVKIGGRPYSPPEHILIKKFVEEGLRDGIIRESKSP
ncbi:hypothetical protein MJO29_016470, partial [Puccinia striiformis f. sp. tritici]